MRYLNSAVKIPSALRRQGSISRQTGNNRPVLVALDDAAGAEQALPMALMLARHWNAPLRLVHVRNPTEDVLQSDLCLIDTNESLSVQSHFGAYLASLAESLRDSHALAVTADTVTGSSVASTLRAQCGSDARALVMVRTRRSAASRFCWGSITDRLIGSLSAPLLLVPADHVSRWRGVGQLRRGFSRILAHLDGTNAAQRVIGNAMALASAHAVCHLLRVMPMSSLAALRQGGLGQDNEQRNAAWREMFQARETLEARGIATTSRVIFDGQTKGAAIVEQARALRAEVIIVAGCHHRLPWWLRSGAAEYVVRHASTPVLIVPANVPLAGHTDKIDFSQQEVSHVDIHSN